MISRGGFDVQQVNASKEGHQRLEWKIKFHTGLLHGCFKQRRIVQKLIRYSTNSRSKDLIPTPLFDEIVALTLSSIILIPSEVVASTDIALRIMAVIADVMILTTTMVAWMSHCKAMATVDATAPVATAVAVADRCVDVKIQILSIAATTRLYYVVYVIQFKSAWTGIPV